MEVCQGSILGGGGGIGIAEPALEIDIGGAPGGGDMLGGAPGGGDMLGGDVLGGPVGTCVGGGATTVV